MANLGQKAGIFHIRFRFRGRDYKKSLKTSDPAAAAAALHVIELTIHRLLTGQVPLPAEVDPGDFILSGGTLLKPVERPAKPVARPATRALIEEYTASQKNL